MPPNPPPIFEFLLFDGFSNMVLASAMEPLRDVRMNAGQETAGWRVTTLDGGACAQFQRAANHAGRRF
ncbi:hypothetical protein [Leisingera sp. M658]|uniref:hypothetical protein n=1 Tax=Leisingera sp. M658 TaxID=2867015 RepID=UPI0021A4374D|nr:hypothetical protein [Leisingera sp. M658]UWQ77133.1 hypothetical protein K3724_21125 [Leisingera sp. M658]